MAQRGRPATKPRRKSRPQAKSTLKRSAPEKKPKRSAPKRSAPKRSALKRSTSASGDAKLGNDIIYAHCWDMSRRVLTRILKNIADPMAALSALVVMQMQSGKAGVIAATIALFVEMCRKQNRTFQVVVLTGISDLSLTKQTRDRLIQVIDPITGKASGAKLNDRIAESGLARYPSTSDYADGMVISNCTSRLKHIDLNMPDVQERIIIVDEGHLGNGQQGCIDTLYRQHGVYIHEPISRWGNHTSTNNHVVIVSATPNAHLIKSNGVDLDGDSLFDVLYGIPPSSYTGISEMLRAGRLRETERYTPDFLQRLWAEGQQAQRALGPGYLVIRAMGEKHAALIRHFAATRQPYMEFDLNANNLSDLNRQFGLTPPTNKLTWLVIRGSMRAGITPPKQHFIRAWIEPSTINADTTVQAGVGRSCGHNRADVYPIYCALAHVLAYKKMYDALERKELLKSLPRAVQSKEMKAGRGRYFVVKVMDPDEAWQERVYPCTKEGRIKSGYVGPRKQISAISGNVLNDCAGLLLEGRHDSISTVGYEVDGPTTDEAAEAFIRDRCGKKNHKNTTPAMVWGWVARNRTSWKRLEAEHPEWVGKSVLYGEAREDTPSSDSRDDLQRVTSSLRNEGSRRVRDLDLHRNKTGERRPHDALDAVIEEVLRRRAKEGA